MIWFAFRDVPADDEPVAARVSESVPGGTAGFALRMAVRSISPCEDLNSRAALTSATPAWYWMNGRSFPNRSPSQFT
jgi:hypothetical protein